MQNIDKKHSVVITDRKQVDIDCVQCVTLLNDDRVSLDTSNGAIMVEGTELKLENLDKANGKITIAGNISAVVYYEKKNKIKGRNIFG